MILRLFLYGTKSRENNGPNGQPAQQCMTPSDEFYKRNRCIQRYWPATNWILWLCFCCGSTVLQASPDFQNVKATITSFEIARWTKTMLCRPVIRSKTAGKLAGPPGP